MAERIQNHALFAPLASRLVPGDAQAIRRRLLANSLRLTDSMAPVAYRAARTAQEVLGLAGELEIYQRSGGENAAIHLVESPVLLEIHGRLLPLLDEGALLGVFGHELGHHLAHGPWGALGRAHGLKRAIGRADLDSELEHHLRGLSMLAELTADRVGLLACQDLHAMLRLEMITLTGLSGEVLTWDTDAYLAQSRELIEAVLEKGEGVYGGTHPEHSLRAYALWLFSESDVYRELTGQGPGRRRLEDIDGLLWQLFSDEEEQAVEPGYHMLDEPPRELHECALAASVIVAHADGVLADEEVEAIERIFAPLVGDWQTYLDREVAMIRFRESAPVVALAGGDLLRALFNLLVHVMGADGVVDPAEVGAILAIGEVLGCEDQYRRLLASTLSALGVTLAVEEVQAPPLPLPVSTGEASDAFEAFLQGIRRRGEAVITLRRLLRLLGSERREQELVERVAASLRAHHIECDEDIVSAEMDQRLHLVTPEAFRDVVVSRPPMSDSTRDGLRRALTRMRDLLVSGDGRSPSVRLRKLRAGRALDLFELEGISVGNAERVLAKVRSGHSAHLVRAAEAGQHRPAQQVANRLKALVRENRSRVEETGANDLYIGYPFLTGNVTQADGKRSGTYLVRAPLVLYPADLAETAKGARGFQAVLRKDETPIVNQSLLRLIFNKMGYAFPDELSDELDALAGDPSQGLEAVLAKLAEVGVKPAHRPGPLQRFRPRDDELAERGNFLELEEVAIFGIFPQSSSDLLQDYDGLIAQLASPSANLGTLLASAQVLLPDALRPDGKPSHSGAMMHGEPRPPVVLADPSQRRVVAECRKNGATVVDGPPGTGKSQVIVNLVADALSRGERVAVVCEKRAALDVVCQRLEGLGLRHILGLVHDVQEDRRELYDQIATRLDEFAPMPFGEQEAANVAAEHRHHTEHLAARDRLLSTTSAAGTVTLGELAALASDASSPLVDGHTGLDQLPTRLLRPLTETVAALRPLADLWRPGSPWRAAAGTRPRPSFATWNRYQLGQLDKGLREAISVAQRHDALLAACPVTEELVESARPGLEAVQHTRGARADHELFGEILELAVQAPERLRAADEATAAWAESGQALVLWERPVEMASTPDFEHGVRVLHRWAGSFLRFFVIGWWSARFRVRSALRHIWPEQSAAPLDQSLLERIATRIAASHGWTRLRQAMDQLGLRGRLPALGTEAGTFVKRVARLVPPARQLATARPALHAAQAWLPQDPGWDRTVDERIELLRARDALVAASEPVRAVFPWIARLPTAAQLEALATALTRDGERLIQADRLLAEGQTMLPSFASLLDLLDASLGADGRDDWEAAVRRSWAMDSLRRAWRQQPALQALGSGTEVREARRAADKLGQLEQELSEIEVERVLARMDQAPLLRVRAPEKHQRRTEEQKSKEQLLKETRKKRRLMPLRSFVRRFAEHGLLDVVPVWLLSPETMAILFPREPLFDLVIFDEASQCTVESGFPVLLRAKRVVVAGDEKQMPPSSYFSLGSSDDDDEPAPEDEDERQLRDMLSAESLLTLARTRTGHAGLAWHYRCQDEALIAFSNHSMYHGGLLTIPATAGPSAEPAMRWVQVDGGEYDAGENRPEAERVVDVVSELLARDPRPSVGVVTFNLRQRRAVLDAIDARCADPGFDALWETANAVDSLDERPFVKNLEQVQGDERDVIVFSLGHAPVQRVRNGQPTGELYVPARFGPLGQRGGERRLNVAISRAKKECFVVSSFEPKQLSVGNTKNEGPKLFVRFLEFAHHMSHGRRAQADHVLDLVREARRSAHHRRQRHAVDGYTPLVTQIALALEAERVPLELDVGASEFRVPLAIPSPEDPSRFVLALLTDEGTEPTTPYDRYVHRPAVLQLRGWDVMHVSSHEWMVRRNEVIDEILQRVPGIRGALDSDVWKAHLESRRRVDPPPPAPKPAARRPASRVAEAVAEYQPEAPAPAEPTGPAWAQSIEDPKFRRALVHLEKHGSLTEKDLINLVGGARRARAFARLIEEWSERLPFRIRVQATSGAKIYLRVDSR